LLGSTATLAFFGERVTRMRGQWLEWNRTDVIATFHPAYLLRKPEDKGRAWEDLLMVKRRLETGS
jgi:DNA polymerase